MVRQAMLVQTAPAVIDYDLLIASLTGIVTAVDLTAAGSGYTPDGDYALTFTGGGGTGAAGTFTVLGGIVTAVALTDGGSGYTSAPAISFTGASGAGAAGVATVAPLLDFNDTDGMTMPVNGNTRLIVQNPTAGPITLTIHSAADQYGGRTRDIVVAIPPGGVAVSAELPTAAFNSGGGVLCNVDADDAGLLYLLIARAPGT